ncbi:hypothetical protein Scep_017906 [Stephania cephalantha]|uniref:Protein DETOXIFICATION n=1 Tax=Stephania cephalantha TaxID=152367 RepID=A0AAP0NUP7_9MAGN
MSAEISTLQKTLLSNRDPAVEADSKPRANSSSLNARTEIDIEPIRSPTDFFREFWVECKKLWVLAAPAVFTSLSRYSIGAVTQAFAGHLGNIELAAVSIANSVIGGFTMGIALGMGSALETLCGQAYGAGRLDMMGVYLQRSWVIVNTTGLILSPLYIFAKPLLRLIGQKQEIADAAGTFALWMLPQLFAYTMNFPVVKFLQAQRKMIFMAVVAAVALGLHTLFSWVLMFKLKWGLVGAAVALNASWWFIVAAMLVYIFNGACGQAWSGFSWMAFKNLWSFVKLSAASAVMLSLEIWYFMALILIAGYLKNPEISVDALSICMNISGWTLMVALGYNAATSVRVSNELGAGHPRSAKFAIVVVVINSFLIGLILALILITFRKEYPTAFTNSEVVRKLVTNLTPLLAFSIVINSVQPVLTGAAVGAGWQALVAYVNIGCYYIFGVPLGLLLGYVFNYGVQGIWIGMISGTVAQTCILLILTYRTNWDKEASAAEDRLRTWGGEPEAKETMNE